MLAQSTSTLFECQGLAVQQKQDQEELEERCAGLVQILNSAADDRLDSRPNWTVSDTVDRHITWIWKMALAYYTDPKVVEVASQWRSDMANLNRRMRNHWTQVEKTSLISLLSRSKKVLKELLLLPPAALSVYVPMARQAEAADFTRALKLFVSGMSFSSGCEQQRSSQQYMP